MEDVSKWLDMALEKARGPDSCTQGARLFWGEWSSVEHFCPHAIRRTTIKMLDKRLQSAGFPSLKTLIELQDGGGVNALGSS